MQRRRVGAVLALVLASASCAANDSPPRAAAPCPLVTATPTPVPAPTPPIDLTGTWDVRWDREFGNYRPALFEGTLVVRREGATWSASLSFRQSVSKFRFDSLRQEGDHVFIDFQSDIGKLEIDARRDGERLLGAIRWKDIPWTSMGGRRITTELAHRSVPGAMPEADDALRDADREALQALVTHATAERSSAIVIARNGKIGLQLYSPSQDGSPIMAMSATKSVVSLAVGLLIAEKKLTLDTRVADFLPEWRNKGDKSLINVRHLLTHTSGLDPSRADVTKETIRAHARDAKLVFKPGTRFQYNNGAVDLLGVVVAQAAHMPLDAYLEARLFQKLGIVGATWKKDSEGTPLGAGELIIRPVDLVKIGQLMLDGGRWDGAQIVAEDWITQSTSPSQPFDASCGLLWWREGTFSRGLTEPVISGWKDAGVSPATLQLARGLLGKKFPSEDDYTQALRAAVGNAGMTDIRKARQAGDHVPFSAVLADGEARGFSARGWLGQQLLVLPKERIVAVRMRAQEPRDHEDAIERYAYREFADDVAKLYVGTTPHL